MPPKRRSAWGRKVRGSGAKDRSQRELAWANTRGWGTTSGGSERKCEKWPWMRQAGSDFDGQQSASNVKAPRAGRSWRPAQESKYGQPRMLDTRREDQGGENELSEAPKRESQKWEAPDVRGHGRKKPGRAEKNKRQTGEQAKLTVK